MNSAHRRICVVGSGPAGLVLALELARHGVDVTLVESGSDAAQDAAQRLSDATHGVDHTHAPMAEAVHRRWGGTSHLWGGRCVPFDPVDFEADDRVGRAAWPFPYDELARFYPQACRHADCGPATFMAVPAGTASAALSERFRDGPVRSDHLERWCAEPVLVRRLGAQIAAEPRITRRVGATCVALDTAHAGEHVARLRLVDTVTGEALEPVSADAFVLACGGVESTRLLLHFASSEKPPRIAGQAHLGRGYMGHLSGKIARIRLHGNPRRTAFQFERVAGDEPGPGHYVRRRLTLDESVIRAEGLLNIAMWLDNAAPADPQHGSGVLSAAYLALCSPILGPRLAAPAIRRSLVESAPPRSLGAHLRNLFGQPWGTLSFAVGFVYAHYFARPRLPGFFAYSATNVYALHYHAEQSATPRSRIDLDAVRDALGVPRARLSLTFERRDAESIVRAHALLDEHLRANDIGRLDYTVPQHARVDAVMAQARDGFHQIGTTRMAENEGSGVTDGEGRVFGVDNLYVCSSALFPTSGQANPTLSIMAFAVRQAQHLARRLAEDGPRGSAVADAAAAAGTRVREAATEPAPSLATERR